MRMPSYLYIFYEPIPYTLRKTSFEAEEQSAKYDKCLVNTEMTKASCVLLHRCYCIH